MGYSWSLAQPSDANDLPNVSGLSGDYEHPQISEHRLDPSLAIRAVDSSHVIGAPENDGINPGLLTKLDHERHTGIFSQPQLADEENVRPANLSSAWTPDLYMSTGLIQHDDQSSNEPPYQHMRMLGHGGSASVEQVLDLTTGSVFARKIIRNVYARNIDKAKRELLNEVRIMQRLASHHHIVNVHAAYVKKRELTMILEPVADGGDLAGYLQNYRDQGFHLRGEVNKKNVYQNFTLRRAFGCLSSALDFIHGQTIRHKDIKPQNILIHQGKVMYTDFGLSYDYGDIGQSTTTGNPQGITKRYCAPEVAEWERRNTKSDVFSLGCVFIEILLALANDAHYDEIYGPTFQEVVLSCTGGVPLPWSIFEDKDGRQLNNVIQMMMQVDSESRPSAYTVACMVFQGMSSYSYCSRCDFTFRADQSERAEAMFTF
ncbi:hypothetical protein J4E86_002760 [Alternaria arbusti]|uniref:uncharacterized protein n=1 Tax=Alternaria arbusti TaxID=232088 RepID=UPI00221EE6CD|nr:uncharacterized protein J4E86_002760 [Alternaria arbusti]KAI4959040.1 hypothetical protein J4E86_002760 [Alternaria arbusti]